MKTPIPYKSSLLYRYARQLVEQRSFAHYSGGNPMRAIIGKRADNAKQRVDEALQRHGASDTRSVPNGIPGDLGERQALIGNVWVSFRDLSA